MSGVDLIGEVPAHWRVKPLRLIGRLLKGTGGSKEDAVENGVPCVRYGDLYTTHNNFIERARTYLTEDRAQDYTPIEYGDVLFAASGETIEEIGKSAVNLLHDARCGGDVVIFRPTEPNVARFFGYAMDAAPVAAQKSLAGRGTTVKHIYPDELREVVIAVPPVGEQQIIADYLDRETARLDALVAAKERMLWLLAEKRRALITRAVTRGLDPRAPLRDSGMPWLGAIPTHWEMKRVKYIFRLIADAAPEDNAFELLSLYTDIGVRPRKELEARGNKSTTTDSYWLVQRGDLIVNKLLAWMGAFGVSDYDGVTSPAYDILRPIADIEPYYYHHLFRCGICQPEIRRRSYGIMDMRLRLYFDRLGDMAVPVPPRYEQVRILDFIGIETSSLDRLSQATDRTIALLKERRAALIAAAVTGQLEVA